MRITYFQEMVIERVERITKTTSILKHKEEINRGYGVLSACSSKLYDIKQPAAEEQSSYGMK